MIPTAYFTFYQNWVRLWLQWADGYVPYIHGGQYGLLSTGIGGSLINFAADKVVGSGVLWKNSRKPKEYATNADGRQIGKALDFISNKWADLADLQVKYRRAIKYAYAGGFSLLKLNCANGELWCDALRADKFFVDMTSDGKITRATCVLAFFNNMLPNNQGKKYGLVEERYYEKLGIFGDEIPVVRYNIYDSSVPIQYMTMPRGNYVPWEQLPKDVRKAFKEEYGGMRLNEPQALNGFSDLGVYLFKGSDEISNVPQANLGESLLAPILTYLYEYDHANTAFNTEIYLGRGRVIVPKYMQNGDGRGDSKPHGLDAFMFTSAPTANPDGQKPEPIQFNVRAQEWRDVRNTLLEYIASGLRVSATSIATYLQGGAQRTAREVSAEEDATTLFVENARKRFEKPMNAMLKQVLRFYGYIDDVEVKWTRAGMTNQTVLVETLSKAVGAGLISREKAHAQFNFDDDEEQQLEDFKKVEADQAQRNNATFGVDGDMF